MNITNDQLMSIRDKIHDAIEKGILYPSAGRTIASTGYDPYMNLKLTIILCEFELIDKIK